MTREQELMDEFGASEFSNRDPEHKSLGWSGGTADDRDWRLGEFLRPIKTSGKAHLRNPVQLDQGSEGSCVGMGTTGVINAEPEPHSMEYDFAYALYGLAKELDPWPGINYEGTSIRAGAEAARQWGYFTGFAFTESVEELAIHVLNHGAATIGVDWYEGMDWVDMEGYIYPTGELRGGHCVCVDGVVWDARGEVNRFRFRNSWSLDWGLQGRGRIMAIDLQKLFDDGGGACAPVEVRTS